MIKLFNFITNLFLHPSERIPDNEGSRDKSYRIVYYEGKFYPQFRKKNGSWSKGLDMSILEWFALISIWFLSGLIGLVGVNILNGKTPFLWSKFDPDLNMPPTLIVFIFGPIVFLAMCMGLICKLLYLLVKLLLINSLHKFIDLLDKPFKNRTERIQTERVRSWDITELRPTPMPRPEPPPRPKPIAVSKSKQEEEIIETNPIRKLVIEN